MRVQIPAYSDMWMRGARFGDVVGTRRQRKHEVRSGQEPKLLYRVKLDKLPNMRPLCYAADDCEVL
jgi:hypothetical protein